MVVESVLLLLLLLLLPVLVQVARSMAHLLVTASITTTIASAAQRPQTQSPPVVEVLVTQAAVMAVLCRPGFLKAEHCAVAAVVVVALLVAWGLLGRLAAHCATQRQSAVPACMASCAACCGYWSEEWRGRPSWTLRLMHAAQCRC
jgi:hypothetical protein